MCRMRNIAMCYQGKRDYQENVTTGQTDRRMDERTDCQTPDKVIPICRYASQVTQKSCYVMEKVRKQSIIPKKEPCEPYRPSIVLSWQ